jgi:hypothetical protein
MTSHKQKGMIQKANKADNMIRKRIKEGTSFSILRR